MVTRRGNHPKRKRLCSPYGAHLKTCEPAGVPGLENIGYADWAAQCKHEFENRILKNVRYDGFKLVAATATRVMFKTYETVEGNDGTINAHGIEVLLEQEADGRWRLVQERVLPADEPAHDQLLH